MFRPDLRWPILLIGFMGAGKSTTGSLAASLLGIPFHDTDRDLETRLGLSIAELFSSGREADFRAAEADMVGTWCAAPHQPCIVALGGGACGDPKSADQIRLHGGAVWLDAPWTDLAVRLQGDKNRPMLQRDPESLYRERLQLYASCARWRLDARLPPHELAVKISQLCLGQA